MSDSAENEFLFLPLGGAGEIGFGFGVFMVCHAILSESSRGDAMLLL